jgi:hypothetical protein
MIRALCPYCGILGWLAPPADLHPAVRARIIVEGGVGRVHECSATALAGVTRYELDAVRQLDDLVELGRTLPMEVRR